MTKKTLKVFIKNRTEENTNTINITKFLKPLSQCRSTFSQTYRKKIIISSGAKTRTCNRETRYTKQKIENNCVRMYSRMELTFGLLLIHKTEGKVAVIFWRSKFQNSACSLTVLTYDSLRSSTQIPRHFIPTYNQSTTTSFFMLPYIILVYHPSF